MKIFEAYPDEQNPEWHCLCFSVYCHNHNIEKAKEEADRIVALGVNLEHYLAHIARSFHQQKENELAKDYLLKAIRLHPTDNDTLDILGDLALEIGEITIAYRCAEKILSDHPYHIKSWFTEAYVLRYEKKVEESLDKLEYILAIDPDNMQATIEKIRTLIILNRLAEAEETIKETIASNKDNHQPWQFILKGFSGDIAFLKGAWQQAGKLYSAVYNKAGLSPSQMLFFAECKMKNHRWKDAERLLKEVNATDNEIVESHELLAEIYLHQGRYDLAARQFRQCMVLAPDNTMYRISCSIALLEGNHKKSAIKILQDTVKTSPGCWEAYSLIAIIMVIQGKAKAAVTALKKACDIEPTAREKFIQTCPQAKQIIELLDRKDSEPNKDV
ncbi:MAG TPA: hypothetical protein DIW30_06945 [Bacteroidales bacterium]|nr:hypothetical protein [Bacteroidales bacterium]